MQISKHTLCGIALIAMVGFTGLTSGCRHKAGRKRKEKLGGEATHGRCLLVF